MATRSGIPAKFSVAFGSSAGAQYITYPTPTPSQIGVKAGAASLTDGFPPLTMQAASAGGVPPLGQDFNGILKQITQWNQQTQMGGSPLYDGSFSASIGGYPQGALLGNAATPGLFWVSLIDNNASDPDTGGSNWANPGSFTGGTVTGTWPSLTIVNSGVTPGTYTSPTITVRADGRISAVASGSEPTYTTLKAGSGATYTTPANCTRLKIRMSAGGAAGSNAPSTTGNNGGQSSFGSTTALGGSGGAVGVGGAGGTGGTTGTGTEILRLAGGHGAGNWNLNVASGGDTATISGGSGGTNPFGGAGTGAYNTSIGAASPNSGAGGAGSVYTANTTGVFTGQGGGGAGEYVEFVINNPGATYLYTIGAGGTSAGTNGAGAAGVIQIEEFYQ